jgi:aspartate carbamoyltransferase catalytic subunit
MTRVQQERFADVEEYERLKDSYILTAEKMEKAKSDTIVLHPLPRVNEISVKIDQDKRACYFKQVLNGKYMRMALILMLLKIKEKDSSSFKLDYSNLVYGKYKCHNEKCISRVEQELESIAKPSKTDSSVLRCVYCDKKVN